MTLLQALIRPDRGENARRAEVARAANLLQVGEFQFLQLAYDEWRGREMPEALINRLFTAYMLHDQTPWWALRPPRPCAGRPGRPERGRPRLAQIRQELRSGAFQGRAALHRGRPPPGVAPGRDAVDRPPGRRRERLLPSALLHQEGTPGDGGRARSRERGENASLRPPGRRRFRHNHIFFNKLTDKTPASFVRKFAGIGCEFAG